MHRLHMSRGRDEPSSASAVVITGSFNFTSAAENSNAENLLVLRDAPLAAKYLDNFKAHLDHSEPYQAKGE